MNTHLKLQTNPVHMTTVGQPVLFFLETRLFRMKLSRGLLLKKILYKKWRKGWLSKTRIIMPMIEKSILSTRHGGRNMRPIFSYRMKRIKLENIMEEVQYIMKNSHEKRRSLQLRVDLLMFFHKNKRWLEKNNHEKMFSHLQTKYSHKDINIK